MDMPLTHVRGIGPARLKALRDAGLDSVRDLVLFSARIPRHDADDTAFRGARAGGGNRVPGAWRGT